MDKNISVLNELIEQSAEANRLLLSNAIAMENGSIAEAQKHLQDATKLLRTMIKYVFEEVKEVFADPDNEEEDYDFSVLDLAKLLSQVIYNGACLQNSILSGDVEMVRHTFELKLLKCINATKSLAMAILLN